MDDVVGKAVCRAQDVQLYRPRARILNDSDWNGVLIFNASAPSVPAQCSAARPVRRLAPRCPRPGRLSLTTVLRDTGTASS